ncbi:MAG TPA: TIGR04282 family arsenosugar biosynthesis glycosyltransferase [Gammaproteobacteria bacterium]|nr:TIGR04282 family arsenosugar biosynthesis glycosyltransferase [Gammaproteobacteria bacterium]
MTPGSTTILVFAKAPEPGQTKTRLIPTLGAKGAATLHEKLIRHAVTVARDAELGPVELWCAPSSAHPLFGEMAATGSVTLRDQPLGDLGQRMQAALDDALARHAYVLLIGSDCFEYSVDYLRTAADVLRSGNDAVLGPAADGGYVLIGLARNHLELFAGIAWGGSTVLGATRDRLRRLGWSFRELPVLNDIDRPEDVPMV